MNAKLLSFKDEITEGIPLNLPELKEYDKDVSHAPIRVLEGVLTKEEKKLALKNALRYFDSKFHDVLAPEFYK